MMITLKVTRGDRVLYEVHLHSYQVDRAFETSQDGRLWIRELPYPIDPPWNLELIPIEVAE